MDSVLASSLAGKAFMFLCRMLCSSLRVEHAVGASEGLCMACRLTIGGCSTCFPADVNLSLNFLLTEARGGILADRHQLKEIVAL